VSGLQRRLRERGCAVQVVQPELAPQLLVLAERRPLEATILRRVRDNAARTVRPLLANLLTPELDISLRDAFDATVQTADASPIMLDVFVEWLLQEGAA
jgi:hypothetical protein